ncbi:transcriptional regulator [Mycolicibacterium canariasense]|uniref:Transcriptional regulator n=1 Tax=Mycolicibacterium canariasense TaxID=228230 RepID=A0A100WJE8_MYCCR|nr:IclR family transcriptional regulator [Mycolicibacterium canariasense]MCV7208061.1 IclR family transcriptional regulator [Mycolicibacterium canariasense]ORV11081.1 IclR family transcriptional regulator [Mycolicibacterium canariasense]GAS99196.1 transcriptional regulator [Mycolicibacterium canariasense]
MAEGPTVVGRVAAILRVLSAHPNGAGTSEVAATAAIPRPSAHRLLEALEAEGLVDRDQQSGRWYLGPETFVLGAASAARFDVTSKAGPHVHRLAAETGESAFFSLRRGQQTVVMQREDGDFPIRSHVLYEGARFPLGVVSAGLAVLAYLPDDVITTYLQEADLAAQWGPSHSTRAVLARIEDTRTNGWAVNPGLIVEGSWGMAAAVFDPHQSPVGALTLTGIEQRFTAQRRQHLGRLLLREANHLSQRIG